MTSKQDAAHVHITLFLSRTLLQFLGLQQKHLIPRNHILTYEDDPFFAAGILSAVPSVLAVLIVSGEYGSAPQAL
jgi:hypothetical protein